MLKAVQQIMLGSVTKNETQARETLRRISAAGYDGVELNRFMIHPSGMMVRALTRMAGMPTGKGGRLDWETLIRESGLKVSALHTDLGSLEQNPEETLADAEKFGTDVIVITGMYRFDYSNAENMRKLAERLNTAGESLRKSGKRLLYHNHNIELTRTGDGRRAFEILIDETDAENVNFEFDSYWFADGGAEPAAWARKLGKRMQAWHVTDRGCRVNGQSMTPILKEDSVELGCGNMDLEGLMEIARENGTKTVVLESHRNWVEKDPVRSLEISAEWLDVHVR